MHLEHAAIWTLDLEPLKAFYETYFEGQAGQKYTNPAKGFASYFLTFASGARLELMQRTALAPPMLEPAVGLAHLAFAVGSGERVEALTERLRQGGYPVEDGPRWTGDGYYESVILDPDGNRIEITI
jgi:lactoylglutathione lyase